MQEHTWNNKMHALRQPISLYPYYTISAAIIPRELSNEDRDLQRIVRLAGVCFARIERQISEDLFRLRIAVNPSRLDDNEQSYLLFVSSAELQTMAEIFQLSADIIPQALLNEDRALEQITRRHKMCFARVEREIDWDLYCMRIAADPCSLDDDERSYCIYVSLAELLLDAKTTRTQQKKFDSPGPTDSSVPVQRKDTELRALKAITISEEEIRKAERTMDPLEGNLLTHKHRPGSKLLRRLRQWIDLLLFRAVLAALEYQKDLQDAVRQALVSRRWSGKRLINIVDMYEKDHHTYWSIQIYVPVSCI